MLFPLPSNQNSHDRLIETASRLYKASAEVSADYSIHDAILEASEIHGIADLHNDEVDERYGEYEELMYEVEKSLGLTV